MNLVELLGHKSITEACLNLPRVGLEAFDFKCIPSEKGLYIWWIAGSPEARYVGIALNKSGLFQRVARQHLNPKYLEYRPMKFGSWPVYLDTDGRSYVEKSVFRKKVARSYGVTGGEPCVDLIKTIFEVSVMTAGVLPDESVRAAEKLIVSSFQPIYNTTFNKSAN